MGDGTVVVVVVVTVIGGCVGHVCDFEDDQVCHGVQMGIVGVPHCEDVVSLEPQAGGDVLPAPP